MNVTPIRQPLNDTNFLKRLRSAAADTSRIVITDHARKRMKQRKVTFAQVALCLQKGVIREHAALTPHGDWKATIGYRCAGDDLSVAVALERDTSGDWCVVITVMS